MTPSKTILTTNADEAAAVIRRGGIVAFPTETVYGLGADVFDETAVRRIFEAKRRQPDNPLIAHIYDKFQINDLAINVNETARLLIDAFFPGPLTVVLERAVDVPLIATAGLDTVGIRMPRLPLAHEFLTACKTPVVAPSANLSGRPSPTTWQAVLEDLDGRIDCILHGDATEIGVESTVVDCTLPIPTVLRPGSISLEEIAAVVSSITVGNGEVDELQKSPGMRYRHYSPRARVKIVDRRTKIANFLYPGRRFAYIGLRTTYSPFSVVKICSSINEYARSLFEFFRECDRQGIDEIYCEAVEKIGIGTALMDRLERAAED